MAIVRRVCHDCSDGSLSRTKARNWHSRQVTTADDIDDKQMQSKRRMKHGPCDFSKEMPTFLIQNWRRQGSCRFAKGDLTSALVRCCDNNSRFECFVCSSAAAYTSQSIVKRHMSVCLLAHPIRLTFTQIKSDSLLSAGHLRGRRQIFSFNEPWCSAPISFSVSR